MKTKTIKFRKFKNRKMQMIWISEMITMDNKIMTSKRKLTSSRTAIIEAIQFKTGKKMLRTSFTSIG